MKMDKPGLWAKALRITFLCLSTLTIALAAAEAIALLYLYSFDRDPTRWSNVTEFYYQPNQNPGEVRLSQYPEAGLLLVRGNSGSSVYASRYRLNLADLQSSALHD